MTDDQVVTMPKKIYVLIDHGKGAVRNASWEALALAQKVSSDTGMPVSAVILGHEIDPLIEELRSVRLGSVIAVRNEKLAGYDPDASTAALRQLLEEDSPELLLMAHIYQNIDLAPKLAASLDTALVTDCIGYRSDGDQLVFTRQMFRNKLNADVVIRSSRTGIVTLQAGAAGKDDLVEGDAQLDSRSIDLSGLQIRRLELEAIEAAKGRVDLTKAEIIVGVGRGIKKEENLSLIRELADALGAEIGASRPVVDNDWMERERQIGSSGQNVSPKLYIGCGISGAIQHVVGIKSSQCIVAINTDPNAPIFNIANYGVVGDLFDIVPKLTKRLKETSG